MLNEIKKTLTILRNGGIILYPTDTVWGIGCDSKNSNAISRVFKIKKRINSKALISLVANTKQLKSITGIIPNIDINSDPTTMIYPSAKGVSRKLLAENGSIGIRIVQDVFCQELISRFGGAIVSTSANISGQANPNQFSEISNEIKNNVDYIVNLRHDELMTNPSRIFKINKDGSITKIR